MKKLIQSLFVFGIMAAMVSCDDDETTPPLSDEERQVLVLEAAQTAVDAVVSVDGSATGVTDASVFDGWTAAFNAGQLGGSAVTQPTVATAPEVDVTANIEANTTWTKDNVYVLRTRVSVVSGVTLTIEPGTIIKGDASVTAPESATLMIARGATLIANGTAAEPIIFTSSEDDIQPGQLLGTNLDQDDKGKWGGLVVLGAAPVSAKTDDPQIEGVPAEDTNGRYGGTDAADNSGSIRYVSLRHGGAEFEAGSEINGLTLGGVGSGTTIEYVEVYANSDDGIEFFGGTVDVDNALVYTVGDDALDVDQSYAGTVDNFLIFVDSNSDEALEIDGREGTLDDVFTLQNGTAEGLGDKTGHCDFKSKAKGTVDNFVTDGKIKLSASFDAEDSTYPETEDAALNAALGSLVFDMVNTTEFEVYTKSFDE